MKSSSNVNFSFLHLKPFMGNICYIACPCILFPSQFLRYEDSLLWSQSFIYFLLAFAYRSMTWHIPSMMPFCTISRISTSVSGSNSTLNFFRHACHANPHAKKSMRDQARIFLRIYCRSFRIYLPIVYHFVNINYDTLLGFLFWNLPRFFSHVFSKYLWCFSLSDCCGVLSNLAMSFH